ncbi:MAG: hypothetical protein R3Y04_08285 [Rikenellaceae bacterium]
MKKILLLSLCFASYIGYGQSYNDYEQLLQKIEALEASIEEIKATEEVEVEEVKTSRLTLGGYGEAIASRNFYSSSWQRYALPSKYEDDKGYGRFDIPRAVFMIGYDFGKGWTFGSEIEFEHGGVGATVEIEEEETGEYESEIEQGGEVVLEQFWINKSWSKSFNLRMGHQVVPVGFTNKYHLPTQYFGVSRPEGEVQIIPTVWHETGISFWGDYNDWSYELMFLPGLDADRFSPENWVAGSAGTIYEFKIANSYATAFRVDNKSVKDLTIGLSGYYGRSANNTLNSYGYSNSSHGSVAIGALDWTYKPKNFIIRGGAIYGYLGDSYEISVGNAGATNASPSPAKPAVASNAISIGMEAGYNIFSLCQKLTKENQTLYVFGRYDYYDSMFKTETGVPDYAYWEREVISVGINYSPIKQLVFKAEYQMRNLVDPIYNDENTFSIGVMWTGFFDI